MSITNAAHLAHAISEAKRFIAAAEKVQKYETVVFGTVQHHWYASPKDTGATRRASMDLTRALADLRRSS
jgi:hypothetical protein